MALRDTLAKRIRQKREELEELEAKVRETRAYLQALEDTFRMVPSDLSAGMANGAPSKEGPRQGGQIAKARDALVKAGSGMHVSLLLEAIGKTVNRANKQALASQLTAYSKKGDIFTKLAPNTFGLIEFGVGRTEAEGQEGTAS